MSVIGPVESRYREASLQFQVSHNTSLEERCVLCTQRMLKYLKLHTKSTNRKRFSPVVVDNIIKNFVFCPKILLHAAISRNPTTHKFLLHTSCRKTRYFFGAEYTEGA